MTGIIKTVIKSNGFEVAFEPEKTNRMAEWAATIGVCWSSIVFDTMKKLTDRCTTAQIQEALIDSCAEKSTPEHLAMASRLFVGSLYKTAHGGFEVRPHLTDFYRNMVVNNVWEKMPYSDEELIIINSFIDHDKDVKYAYSTVKQIASKYARKINGEVCETPQFTFMGIAMRVMQDQPSARRLDDVYKLYTYLSDLKINAPTPFLSGLRTKFKGYASCAVMKAEDTAESLGILVDNAYTLTIASAGIGSTMQCRSIQDPVRNGDISHTGKLPYYRYLEGAVKSTKQSTRGGSSTMHYLSIDPEVEDLLRLKHPTTVADKQIRGLDYSIGVNRYFAEKAARGEEWMLCSYYFAPEVHEAMHKSYEEFKVAYESYEKSGKPKKFLDAQTLLLLILKQRQDTGRIYVHWLDEMNTHTPFREPIYSSNLCKEIHLPTSGFLKKSERDSTELNSEFGEIALCFLSSIVAGRVSPGEYEDVAYYTALMIDNVIDIMEYPFVNLEVTAKARRSIGIGVTNLAHYMALNNMSYTTLEGKNFMHEHAEMHSFFVHKASLRLAKEKGVCEWIGKTKYPTGWLPVDTYNRNVDSVHTSTLKYDWEELRKEIIEAGGLRNSVLEASPPCESSSLASQTTNCIYPIRDLYVTKKSGTTKVIFGAPDAETLSEYYELAWDVPARDLIDMYAIFQKFHGQGISCDLYTDFSKYPDEKVPSSKMFEDFFYSTRMGLKAWYYQNSKGGISKVVAVSAESSPISDEEDVDDSCTACKM